MKKLHFIFTCFLVLAFQACKQESGSTTNERSEPSQSVMETDETGSSINSQDTSTADMAEHTRMNRAADSAKEAQSKNNGK